MNAPDIDHDDIGAVFFYGEDVNEVLAASDPFVLLAAVEEEMGVPLAHLVWRD